MRSKERVYWDSDVFISAIQRHPARIAVLEQCTERAQRGELEIIASAFTLCEVAKVEGVPLPEEQEQLILDFFENPYVLIQQLDTRVAARTRDIVRRFNLPAKDAVHLASALQAGVAVVYSYDQDHMLPQDGKIGDPPLRIQIPRWKDGQPPLITEEE